MCSSSKATHVKNDKRPHYIEGVYIGLRTYLSVHIIALAYQRLLEITRLRVYKNFAFFRNCVEILDNLSIRFASDWLFVRQTKGP